MYNEVFEFKILCINKIIKIEFLGHYSKLKGLKLNLNYIFLVIVCFLSKTKARGKERGDIWENLLNLPQLSF